jgi:hypothetical protein
MSRKVLSLAVGLCLALIPLASAAEENYGAILQALPDPVPVVTSSSCLTGGADAPAVADPAFLALYSRPFDDDAGKAVVAYLNSAIAAAPGSAVAPLGPADFDGQTPSQAFALWYSSLGLDPANVLDVAALYLMMAWAAQEDQMSVLVSLNSYRVAAVKAQLIGAEQRCAFLLNAKEDLAAYRNQMIALTGILIDGMESHSRSDTLESFAAAARGVFDDQIGGLLLIERGFVTP